MYVTRPSSMCKKSDENLYLATSEGPNSSHLVLYDDESESPNCFVLCQSKSINELPFPQNKDITVLTMLNNGESIKVTYYGGFLFIPVLGQPLSSNRYYIIHRQGIHKGLACTSSKEENKGHFCCFTYIQDAKPREFDPSDVYQQFEIIYEKFCGLWGFFAKSVAPDGNPPRLLRTKYWGICIRKPQNYLLSEASGIYPSLRAVLPSLNLTEAVVVGKWYCPFMFVKEHNVKVSDQMKMSCFYEVTLEQRWDKIFGCDNVESDRQNVVRIDVVVESEEVFVSARKVVQVERKSDVIWFKSSLGENGERVGLSTKVLERMKWEQERVGWVDGIDNQVRVERREEFEGSTGWTKFGCYVLVERFVFKRMDESIVLAYDFKHTHQIRCNWE